jgi:hypothetical protein
MNKRAWCTVLSFVMISSACDEGPPPAERPFDIRESTVRYARYDFKQGLIPIGSIDQLDPIDAQFVVIRDNKWPALSREAGYYIADLRAAQAGSAHTLTARLTPRKDIIVHALARQEGINRAAGIAFLAGELANLTPGSDRERTSQDSRARFYDTNILPPERDPKRLAAQNPTLPPAPDMAADADTAQRPNP